MDAGIAAGKKLLEVGTGLGNLLLEARARGYDVSGVEYGAALAARANARLGGRGRVAGDRGLGAASRRAASTSACSPTSSSTPRSAARDGRRRGELLAPGGALFVATPSLDSWSARLDARTLDGVQS